MRHIFILNSFTLKERTIKTKERIQEFCLKNKIDHTIETNSYEYSTEDILDKYRDNKNIIIAVGGDGLVNRVLNKIAGTDNVLGIIPAGTGNDFYRTVEKQLIDNFNQCDIVKINDKYFINTACFGIDADVANNKGDVKIKTRKHQYNLSLVKTFFKYKCRPFTLRVNGQEITSDFGTIVVCNGGYYGNGYNIGPNSNITDGQLEVYAIPKISKLGMINIILKAKNGKHIKSNKVKQFTTTNLSITSPEKVLVNIDGEELLDSTFNIELLKNKISIYYNKNLLEYIQE